MTRFEKKAQLPPTHYGRIYIEIRIVILIKNSIGLRFESELHFKRFRVECPV